MENKYFKLPFNIQYFADDAGSGNPGGETGTQNAQNEPQTNANEVQQPPDDGGEPKVTIEQLMTELAAERAEKNRFKASIDKLTHENKELNGQLRQRMTAAEQDELAKQEQEAQQKAYIEELEAFKRKTEAEKRYQLQGMSAELAEKAAAAEVNGNMDELATIQKQHTDALIKAKEAEWLGSRPNVNAGDGNAYSSMSKEEIMAIEDSQERLRAIAMNMELFK